MKIENYDGFKHFRVKFSDKTQFEGEDMKKIIKKALISAKIKISEESIIERSVEVTTKNPFCDSNEPFCDTKNPFCYSKFAKKYIYLLEDSVANSLAEKNYTIPVATAKLIFKLIKPSALKGFDCLIHGKKVVYQ